MSAPREWHNAWVARRRAAALAYLGGVCVDCGCGTGLEFDHRDPAAKSFTITGNLNRSWVVVLVELDKCVLRCKPCHSRKTILERGQVPAKGTHGTLSAYRYCRCDLCRAAKSISNKSQRQRARISADR
jgi:hypothetical protein